jgi:SNF2 family DNA or RNA helicase
MLADEPGLGKTLQCLTLLALLPEVHPHNKHQHCHVVISPDTASDQWIKQQNFIDNKKLRICDMTNPATSEVRRPLRL